MLKGSYQLSIIFGNECTIKSTDGERYLAKISKKLDFDILQLAQFCKKEKESFYRQKYPWSIN